jgi:hypothetical protein
LHPVAGFDGAVDTAWGWSELRVARSRRRPFSCGGCRELSVVGRMRGTGLELGWPGRDARPCAGIPGPYCIRIRFAWVHDHYVVFRLFCSRISHDPRSPYLTQYILNPGRQEIGHHVVCTQVRHPPVATAKCQVHLIVPRRRPPRDLPGEM